MARVCIIYKLINRVNGKVYIGQTWQSLKDRWDSGSGYYRCPYLSSAIKKYGKKNFYYEILAIAESQAEADDLEKLFIIKYNSRNPQNGYNIREGGATAKMSDETKLKISKINKGKFRGKKNPFYGRTHSEESKKLISQNKMGSIPWNLGIPRDEKTKKKISKARLGKYTGEENGFYNKTHTEQQRQKWSKSRRELSDDEVRDIRLQLITKSIAEVARATGYSSTTISRIKNNIRYQDVK